MLFVLIYRLIELPTSGRWESPLSEECATHWKQIASSLCSHCITAALHACAFYQWCRSRTLRKKNQTTFVFIFVVWFNLISLRRVNKFPYECIAVSLTRTAVQAFQIFFSHFLIILHALLCSSAKNPSSISFSLFAAVGRQCRLMNHIQLPSSAHKHTTTAAECKFQCNRPGIKASRWVLKLMPISLAWNFISTFLIWSSGCHCSTIAAPTMNLNDNIQVQPTARIKVNQGRLVG